MSVTLVAPQIQPPEMMPTPYSQQTFVRDEFCITEIEIGDSRCISEFTQPVIADSGERKVKA